MSQNPIQTIITHIKNQGNYLPADVEQAITQLQSIEVELKQLWVTPNVAEVCYGLIPADTREEALDTAQIDWQGYNIEQLTTLYQHLGLGE